MPLAVGAEIAACSSGSLRLEPARATRPNRRHSAGRLERRGWHPGRPAPCGRRSGLPRAWQQASPLNAASSALEFSVPRIARDHRRRDRPDRLWRRRSARAASVPASPRSARTGRIACASRSSSPGRRWASTMTGAEKPRLIDSNGASVTPANSIVAVFSRGRLAARPRVPPPLSAPNKAVRSGIGIGCLCGWPGVGGMVCVRCRIAVRAPAS